MSSLLEISYALGQNRREQERTVSLKQQLFRSIHNINSLLEVHPENELHPTIFIFRDWLVDLLSQIQAKVDSLNNLHSELYLQYIEIRYGETEY